MKIVLYSTHCPKCKILESKLREKNIIYEEINDVNIMTEKGFTTVPMLQVGKEIMDYKNAFNYVNSL